MNTPTANLHSAHALRYQIEILRGDSVALALPWSEHMITDAGYERLASEFGPAMITVPIVGEAPTPTPVRRDGGAITFSQTGDIVATDGAVSFFAAEDVGRLLKFGIGTDGAECCISEFISAASVRVDKSATVTSQPAVVWYTNTAALLQPITGLSWSTVAGAAYNYTQGTVSGDVVTITHQCVKVSSAFAAAKTITEIAFSSTATNENVFDRDVIQPGAGILVGDQARVTVQLIYKVSGVTPVSVPDFGTGANTAGQSALVSVGLNGIGYAKFGEEGTVATTYVSLDPCANSAFMQMKVINGDFGIPGFSLDSPGTLSGETIAPTLVPYVSGSHHRDLVASFSTAAANGTIYGFSLSCLGSDMFIHKITTPFTKTNSQTLSLIFRKSFRRLLNN